MKPAAENVGGIAPRAFLIVAVAANAGIAVAKIIVYTITGSASMLAESIHSMADTCNELLMMWGGRRASRPADAAFSFGYARERYFWSFIVAVLLFTLGGLYSILDGAAKLGDAHEVVNPHWAIAVIFVAAILEGSSLRVAIKIARPHVGKDGWWQFIRTTKSPEAPVVLLEDTAALIGLTLAFFRARSDDTYRRSDVRRDGQHRHRVVTHRRRWRSRHRDEGPPDWGIRLRADVASDSGRARRSAGDPPDC